MWQKPGLPWRSCFTWLLALSAACVPPEVGSICPPPTHLGWPEYTPDLCACQGRHDTGELAYYDVWPGRPIDVLLVVAACSADSNACFCVESSQNQVCHWGTDQGDLVGIWVPLSATPPVGTGLSIRCALDECSPP